MADKTTTLKTKTNDNVYPNIIGDNMDNAIVDSAHINHTLTKDHKINFRLDTNVSGLIFNSLQKPTGLTKTELVGVGANGQENIEIGDNLTLANGKLSATGGGSGGTIPIVEGTIHRDTKTFTFNSNPTDNYFLAHLLYEGAEMYVYSLMTKYTLTFGETSYSFYIGLINLSGVPFLAYSTSSEGDELVNVIKQFSPMLYSHFITLTNGYDNIYITFQNTYSDSYDMVGLTTALSEKSVLCTGNLGNSNDTKADPKYISGEAGGLEVYYVLQNDTSGTITSKSVTSFTITDIVTLVE